MKRIITVMSTMFLFMVCLLFITPKAHAAVMATYSGFKMSYDDTNYTATISDCIETKSGVVYIPSSVYGYRVVGIDELAFQDCTRITEICFPNQPMKIGPNAFYGCTGIRKVDLGGVEEIEYGAFSRCTALSVVEGGQNLKSIGNSAFNGCGIYTFTIPEGVTTLGTNILSASHLTTVYYNATNASVIVNSSNISGALPGSYGAGFKLVIGKNVEIIPNYLAAYASVKSLEFEEESICTEIGAYAFYCNSALTTAKLGNNITKIGLRAFQGSSSLESISNTDQILTIDQEAFHGTKWLITQPEGVVYLGKVAYGFNGTSIENVTIKEGTLCITKAAFAGRTQIKSVFIPEGIKTIPSNAFDGCSGLTTVFLPQSLEAIGAKSFYQCSALTTIELPINLLRISEWAFSGCSGLQEVHVSSIDQWCRIEFSSISSANPMVYAQKLVINGETVEEIVLPKGLTQVGCNTFYGCTQLTSVVLPEGIEKIGYAAFYGCTGLREITIPNTTKIVDTYAFSECSRLLNVTFGSGMETVSNYAFDGCDELDHICYAGDYKQWNSVSIGSYNTVLYTIKHYNCEGSPVYWNKNCANRGYYCDICYDFLTREAATDGKHTYSNALDRICDDCDYERKVTAISLYKLPNVLEYELGHGQFDATGGVILARFTDGTSEKINLTNDVVTGFYNDRPGICPMAAKYDGEVVLFDVKIVLGTPDTLEIAKLPTTTQYLTNTTLNLTGLEVLAVYEGIGSYELDINDLTCGKVDMSTAGVKSVQVSFKSVAASFQIQVFGISKVEIVSLPNKVDYIVGEKLDLTGLNVSAYYADQVITDLDKNSVTVIASAATSSVGRKEIIVQYKEASTVFYVYVHNKDKYTVNSSLYPESQHNYASNTNESKLFSWPGAGKLVLTFSSNSYTESNYDWVYIYDKFGTQIGKYSGSLAGKVVTITGDSFTIKLTSDSSVNKYGYAFSSIVAETVLHTYQGGKCTICGKQEPPLVLAQNTVIDKTLTSDLYVDLNGYDLSGTIVTNGYKVYGMDSTTDSYTCESIGYMNLVDENGNTVVPVSHFKSDITGSVKRYMSIPGENGYSFHRFYLGITHMTLRPDTAGVGYKAVFYGDDMVVAMLKGFGFKMQLGQNTAKQVTGTTVVSGKTITLRIDHYDVEKYGETPLKAAAVLVLHDGTVIESTVCTTTFRSVVESINANYMAFATEQLALLKTWLQKYAIVKDWAAENLLK